MYSCCLWLQSQYQAAAGKPLQASLARSVLLVQLQDAVIQRGRGVCIADFTNCEEVKHLLVLEEFGFFELVNCKLSVVDSDEIDKLAVILNVDVHLLDVRLIINNIFLDSSLGLEERLEGSFT